MISLSRLMGGRNERGDSVRFPTSERKYPAVLILGLTRNCNLNCLHCYSNSGGAKFIDLPLDFWLRTVEEAGSMGVRHIVLTGGEPLMMREVREIARHAQDRGISVEISTNGTVLRTSLPPLAEYVNYVGVSLDGPPQVHDELRGLKGAHRKALEGARFAKSLGLKVGLRFTITALNWWYVDEALNTVERERLDRICFYHLAYVGRAERALDVDNSTRLNVVEHLLDKAKGVNYELLTADNPVDGILAYLITGKPELLNLLRANGGNRSGERVAYISPEGVVYPDQFTPVPIGVGPHLKELWDGPAPLVEKLRERRRYVECSSCPFFPVCNGGLRGRALAVTGDLWAKDPSCYLQEALSRHPISVQEYTTSHVNPHNG
ncbi:heme d1 biosynthesis radical SAM protein NirJ1 [Sulfodiicoccus acidiphilus]|uniref:Heme d1 biosynthesis radical SAM protein NirJ1 n=1 Tax=Sulfodiicoccus acidiphilus TaxID=1670455 RepID=A0A348B244_9CREN|nr:radical SAM protein [Sulfodiicoccus acidiphilus]BBD72246.1 heme d1 biosynthesis radical SAM protein NirJ1 [Sulfodiicoccus acidiphilus]GGT90815.1 heme d1 biosynthesis radical SAM protein NirJ1 [Sulfodiicoccus acidiphilus]